MIVEYSNRYLKDLAEDGGVLGSYPPGIVKKYRKIVTWLNGIENRLSIYNWKGLQPHQLEGDRKGKHGIWINDQFRIVLEFRKEEDGKTEKIVILEIEDYHK